MRCRADREDVGWNQPSDFVCSGIETPSRFGFEVSVVSGRYMCFDIIPIIKS